MNWLFISWHFLEMFYKSGRNQKYLVQNKQIKIKRCSMRSCFMFHGITSCTLKEKKNSQKNRIAHTNKKKNPSNFAFMPRPREAFPTQNGWKSSLMKITVMFTFTMNDGEDPQTADSTKLQKELYIIYFLLLLLTLSSVSQGLRVSIMIWHTWLTTGEIKERSSGWEKIRFSVLSHSVSLLYISQIMKFWIHTAVIWVYSNEKSWRLTDSLRDF